MTKKFTVGVIGAGRIGKIHIENVLRKISNVKLKVVADVKIDDNLKSWANRIGISSLTNNPYDIIKDSEIDTIIIASSTNSHSEFIQLAAKAQKSIFCEKPLDTDLNRIKETLNIVNQEGVKLMIGFNRRFDRNFRKIKELIRSGQIGIPQIIKITSRDPALPPMDYIKASGGLFIDMTIHDWDMAQFQMGSDVEEVYTKGAALIEPEITNLGDIDTAVAVLKFENGALGIIDNSRQAVYGYDQRVEVFGSNGCIIADNEPTNTITLFTANLTKKDNIPYFFLERYMDSYEAELLYFFKCLNSEEQPFPDGNDGLKSVLVALAAQRSLIENRPVKISEIDW
ncbi:MAG: inositol 2-dehydrogenase [Candidatus Thorarchaeota archaeon]